MAEKIQLVFDCKSPGYINELQNFSFPFVSALVEYASQSKLQIKVSVICLIPETVTDFAPPDISTFLPATVELSWQCDDANALHPNETSNQSEELTLHLCSGDFFSIPALIDIIDSQATRVIGTRILLNARKVNIEALNVIVTMPSQALLEWCVKRLNDYEIITSKPTPYWSDENLTTLSWYYPNELYIRIDANPTLVTERKSEDDQDIQQTNLSPTDYQWLTIFRPLTSASPNTIKQSNPPSLFTRALYLSKSDYSTFEAGVAHPLIVQLNQGQEPRITNALKSTESLQYWVKALKNIQYVAQDERALNIRKKYEKLFSMRMTKVEEQLAKIEESIDDKSIVLYGMGEFCYFLTTFFKFKQCKVYLSDSNYQNLETQYQDYPVISPESITSHAKTVLLMSMEFRKEMTKFLKDLFGDSINIISVSWEKL